MVLLQGSWWIKEAGEDYLKWTKKGLSFWQSALGFKEMRGYRDPLTGRRLFEVEFEDFESLGKVMDSDEFKEYIRNGEGFSENMEWSLWEVSPVMKESR
jgi:hypothetical protein